MGANVVPWGETSQHAITAAEEAPPVLWQCLVALLWPPPLDPSLALSPIRQASCPASANRLSNTTVSTTDAVAHTSTSVRLHVAHICCSRLNCRVERLVLRTYLKLQALVHCLCKSWQERYVHSHRAEAGHCQQQHPDKAHRKPGHEGKGTSEQVASIELSCGHHSMLVTGAE